MAITLSAPATDGAISLDEYMEFVNRELDPDDESSICSDASVKQFSLLLNNRSLVASALNAELRRMPRPLSSDYTATHLILAQSESFAVRANFWTPPQIDPEAFLFANYFNRYRQPHNHRFGFLTGGYSGSGYETAIYEYDAIESDALPGDRARLTLLEHTSLPKGKVMFYRAIRDAHFQKVPQEASVSLNLLAVTKRGLERPTLSFDFERSVVTDSDILGPSSRDSIFRLAEHVGDERVADTLESISQTHPHPIMRANAFATLVRLQPGERDAIVRRGVADGHPYVCELAKNGFSEKVAQSWGAVST
jgi:hypothetical protein